MSKEFKTAQLKNGLQLLGELNSAVKSASIGYFVKTGARDETPKEAGVSHFLEHMMFKGTPKRSSMDITYELGNIGAQANAYTSEENTVYYGAILTEYFPHMQELLSDMLRPSLDPEEFAMEKKVILEEIALYKDKPHFFLYEQALQDFFTGHTAGNSVLGTTDTVGAVTRDEMHAYYSRRYAPNNMVLVASGNFDWDRFVADAEKYCSSWAPHETPRTVLPHTPKSMFKSYKKKDLTQTHVLFLSGCASAQEEERYPLGLLAMILGDGTGSKMYWKLVNQGLVESAGADTDERDGTGCFIASASTESDKLEQVVGIMKDILTKPLDFEDAELERAKNKLAAKVVMGGELPMGRIMAMGTEYQYRKKVTPLSEVIQKIKKVTKSDVAKALEKYPLKEWGEFRLVAE